jgi:predicted Zn-dependent protease
MKRLLPRLLLLLAVLGLGAGGYLGWQHTAAQRTWEKLRPAIPAPLGDSAPGLDERLARCAADIQSWPPDRSALAEFAEVCHANGHLDAASAAYETLLQLDPREPRWPYRLAIILAGYGRLDDAVPLLRRTTELAPDYIVGWLKLGDAHLKSNATDPAKAAYEAVLQREPDNRYAMIGIARCDLLDGRLSAARAQLQRAVAGGGDFAGAQSLLAVVFDQLGNATAAELARGRVQRSGHYTEPVDAWMEELQLKCHDPYKLLTAASAASVEERPERARMLLERGLSLAPNDARLRRRLGKDLAIAGDYAGSRRELERAVELDPSNDGIRFDLLAILRRTKDDAAFERQVEAGLIATPTSAGLHFEAGRIAARAGRLEEATKHLEYSWRVGPDQSAAAIELADVYLRTSRDHDAIVLLEDVLLRFPKEYGALITLIRHGIALGDARTSDWLRRAINGGAPDTLLVELRQEYERKFGPLAP